ncbi:hypothetical protein LH464_11930 [Neorhizobium sp. T786]|uniref:virion core protein, T7 gp14 family n=1 Tax=Pseudorhizobium xiangyangii TaxID=2883104 RepID=UPI001D000D59|nr:hypothetical protein [Neorhizobium xiangyangii]MCB5203179.1 hypothetical protein [Neorhizobium xiangyangii]
MCNPLALLGGALGVLQTGMGFVGAQQQAKAQNDMVRENQKAANANLVREYADVQTRQIQEEDATAVQKQDLSREARAARATTMAAAGEAGVAGLSVDALLADVYGKEAMAKDRISQNSGFITQNLSREMDGLKAKAKDRINSMPWATGPSPFAAALKIGGIGLDSYSSYQKRTPR